MPTPSQLFAQARQALQAGQPGQGARLAQAARAAFAAAGAHDYAVKSMILQSRCQAAAGDLDGAAGTLDQAIAHAESFDRPAEALAARGELGVLQEQLGQLPEALATHRAVLDAQEQRRDVLGAALAAANVARLLPRAAKPEHRRQAQQQALELLLRAGQGFVASGKPALAAQVLVVLGSEQRNGGELTEAAATLRDACRAADAADDPRVRASARLNLGHVLRDRGDTAMARQSFASSAELAHACGDLLGQLRARQAALLLDLDGAPAAEALQHLHDLIGEFAAAGQVAAALPLQANLGPALARSGQVRRACQELTKTVQELHRAGERLGVAEVQLTLAELQWTLGEFAAVDAAVAQLAHSELPDKLAVRLALFRARQASARLDLPGTQAALARALTGEPSHATQFAAGLVQAQLGTWLGDGTAGPLLADLLALAESSPREQAAATLAHAVDLAWAGERDQAATTAATALETWRYLGEPLPQASCQTLLACLGRADPAASFELLAELQREDLAEAHTALRGALCAQSQDLQGVLAAVDALRTMGWPAAALALTHLSRLTLASPQLIECEASIWTSAAQASGDGAAAGAAT
ncbi:MAG: hypothetical protein HY902_03715 [Deltaproteobacteria bacterium]|nr:hypothetical protein [Deltaproteobacteria bacterium]